jgi:hypothetical protein
VILYRLEMNEVPKGKIDNSVDASPLAQTHLSLFRIVPRSGPSAAVSDARGASGATTMSDRADLARQSEV